MAELSNFEYVEGKRKPVFDTYGGHPLIWCRHAENTYSIDNLYSTFGLPFAESDSSSNYYKAVEADFVVGSGKFYVASEAPDDADVLFRTNKLLHYELDELPALVNLTVTVADHEGWSHKYHVALQIDRQDDERYFYCHKGDTFDLAKAVESTAGIRYAQTSTLWAYWDSSTLGGIYDCALNSNINDDWWLTIKYLDDDEYITPVPGIEIENAYDVDGVLSLTDVTMREYGSFFPDTVVSKRATALVENGICRFYRRQCRVIGDTSSAYRLSSSDATMLGVVVTSNPLYYTLKSNGDRTMKVGDTLDLTTAFTVRVDDDNCDPWRVEYSANDKSVASVSGTTLTTTAVGETWVWCLLYNDATDYLFAHVAFTLTVEAAPAHRIVIGSHEWATASDAIVAGGKAVKAVYVCEDGELKQVYG